MRLTVLLTGSRVPADIADSVVPHLEAPTLGRLLARGRRREPAVSATGDAAHAWLAQKVCGDDNPPTASYAWADLTGEHVLDGTIWHADPIHIAVGRESLLVEPLTDESPSEAEADALIEAANASLGDAARIVRAGTQWFLRTAESWHLGTIPMSAAAGHSLLPLANPDHLRWSRLHNSIQMSWHVHAINEARAESGQRTVGGVWLHGGGSWVAHDPLPWDAVHSDRPELRGLAVAAGAQARAATAPVTGDALLVWDDAATARRRQDWPAWLAAMIALDRRLATLPAAAMTLVLAGEAAADDWELHGSDRLRFWRAHRLADVLAEAPA